MKTLTLLLLILALHSCKQSDANKGTTINVKGFSRLSLPPDIAEIKLSASSESISKDSAFNLVNTTINGLLESLKSTGVKTTSVNTGNYDIYFQKEKKTRKILYHGSQTLIIKLNLSVVEIEKLATIAKKFKRADFEISYELSQKKQDSVELILTSLALKDAEKKATHISQNSQMMIDRIINISYHSDGVLNNYRNDVDYEMFDESGNSYTGSLKLIPTPIELTDNVEVSYFARAEK